MTTCGFGIEICSMLQVMKILSTIYNEQTLSNKTKLFIILLDEFNPTQKNYKKILRLHQGLNPDRFASAVNHSNHYTRMFSVPV